MKTSNKLDCSRGLQSGHSMFTKSKLEAKRCIKKLQKDGGQVNLHIKKTNHTIRGKGYLIEAG